MWIKHKEVHKKVPQTSVPTPTKKRRIARFAGFLLLGAAVSIHGVSHFNELTSSKNLNLDGFPGAKPLTENIRVIVSGPQPETIGVETRHLPGERTATTLYVGWSYDGFSEFAKNVKTDVEPITIITDKNGNPEELQVRSHWRVGVLELSNNIRDTTQKTLVAITNAFHTPVIVNSGSVLITGKKGIFNTAIFWIVNIYAKIVGGLQNSSQYAPLKAADTNIVPFAEHPARKQPIFVDTKN